MYMYKQILVYIYENNYNIYINMYIIDPSSIHHKTSWIHFAEAATYQWGDPRSLFSKAQMAHTIHPCVPPTRLETIEPPIHPTNVRWFTVDIQH